MSIADPPPSGESDAPIVIHTRTHGAAASRGGGQEGAPVDGGPVDIRPAVHPLREGRPAEPPHERGEDPDGATREGVKPSLAWGT